MLDVIHNKAKKAAMLCHTGGSDCYLAAKGRTWLNPSAHLQHKPTQAAKKHEQFCIMLMKFLIYVSPKLNRKTRLPALVIK